MGFSAINHAVVGYYHGKAVHIIRRSRYIIRPKVCISSTQSVVYHQRLAVVSKELGYSCGARIFFASPLVSKLTDDFRSNANPFLAKQGAGLEATVRRQKQKGHRLVSFCFFVKMLRKRYFRGTSTRIRTPTEIIKSSKHPIYHFIELGLCSNYISQLPSQLENSE